MADRALLNRLLTCCLILLAPTRILAAEQDAANARFRLMDEVFAPEIEEVITISINHVPVGTMTLGPHNVRDSFMATVPVAALYHYDLCGHATIRDADGKVKTIKIDNGGILDHLDGRTLGIFDGEDYLTSYLRDMKTDARSEATPPLTTGHSCPATVS